MKNFRRPYSAQSLADFWRRWHISLSTWFRDYVYISLGGNRTSVARWHANILVVFLLSGLWHGAGWTFVLWGALHGIYLLSARWLAPLRAGAARELGLRRKPRVLALLRVVTTFHLVCFAWIFFRAASLADAMTLVRGLFTGLATQLTTPGALTWQARSLGDQFIDFAPFDGAVAAAAVVVLVAVHTLQARYGESRWLSRWPIWARWPAYWATMLAIIVFGVDGAEQFIYFQF
jgi:hypothetical protein